MKFDLFAAPHEKPDQQRQKGSSSDDHNCTKFLQSTAVVKTVTKKQNSKPQHCLEELSGNPKSQQD